MCIHKELFHIKYTFHKGAVEHTLFQVFQLPKEFPPSLDQVFDSVGHLDLRIWAFVVENLNHRGLEIQIIGIFWIAKRQKVEKSKKKYIVPQTHPRRILIALEVRFRSPLMNAPLSRCRPSASRELGDFFLSFFGYKCNRTIGKLILYFNNCIYKLKICQYCPSTLR